MPVSGHLMQLNTNDNPCFLYSFLPVLWSLHGASLVAQLVKNLPAMQKTPVQFLGTEIPWRRDRLPTPVFLGFPSGSDCKEITCNVGDLVLSQGQEDPLEEGMATHSSVLAWRISWTEEHGGLQSMGSQRVRQDWVTFTLSLPGAEES